MRTLIKYSLAALLLTTAGTITTTASADIVQLDDVIIDGSLCVGMDCINGESFDFDTIRLKENNLRVHFDDTSASATFPSNDWRIVVNSSDNGGASYFAIEDATAGRQPFRVDAGAPVNSLIVDSQGDIGIGTASPVVELHVADGDTPTLRLEQDGSSGFTPQTWDVAGNETNFFVRNTTDGSKLPFRVFPSAVGDSLVLAGNAIGIGGTPNTSFSGRSIQFGQGEGNDQVGALQYSNNVFRFIMDDGAGGIEMVLDANGNLTIAGTLTTAGMTCGTGCDAVFEEGYELPSIEDHAELMWSNGYLPNVGPTIENTPINVSDKVGRMLNELEKAHIYIAQINEENKQLKAEVQSLKSLEQRLEALESAQ